MPTYVLETKTEFYAPNEKSAQRIAQRITELIFVEDEVNAVSGNMPEEGWLEEPATD